MIYETVRQAFQNIWSNKFRTFLTMLGIIIGVMAVIVIVGLGNGMTQSIKDSFSDMGTDLLSVQVMGYGARSVSVDSVYDIVESHPDIFESVSPTGSVSGTVKVGTDSYSNTTVKGVSEVYFDMLGYTIDEGRLLNYVDLENNQKVCVVGAYLNRVAYGGNALGQTIKIGTAKYTIVGVLEAKVTDLEDQEGSNDDMIFVPYTTAMRANHSSTVSSYSVAIADENKLSEGKTILEDALQELLHSDSGYMVTSLSEMLDTMTSMVNMVVTILTAIAAISLLVGGIGIMNIMLVSVTERTREIGVRLAIGATAREVLMQFLIEAVVLGCMGGVIGILLATGSSYLITGWMDVPYTFDPMINIVSFAFAALTGVIFGYFPARRAARLDPIEAVRHE